MAQLLALQLDEDTHAWLISLAREAQCSMAELFRRGFAVLIVAHRVRKNYPYLHLGLAADPNKLDIEITGVLSSEYDAALFALFLYPYCTVY